MERLTNREKELVRIGAAIASNCIPCIEYHIPEARKAGLTNAQIRVAINTAQMVKKVPADMVLEKALELLNNKER
jgi:AhpD family alkylhydroperoxidase